MPSRPTDHLSYLLRSYAWQVLRMGVYELLYCGLPPYALSQHVGLAKALVRPDAGRLVNGVLRSLARAQEAGQLPDPQVGQKW